MCARTSTGGMAGDTGVTVVLPSPAAVGPMRTILSLYLSSGNLPACTS